MQAITLTLIHDPMCSWCWAFRPVFAQLRAELPQTIDIDYLLGGLAPDSDQPMDMAMRDYVSKTWHRIETLVPDAHFNHDFWSQNTPRRSTWISCRAVIATALQDPARAEDMVEAIQRAYYLQARNPSDAETLIDLATQLGLDTYRFSQDLNSQVVQNLHKEQRMECARLNVRGFPSLILNCSGAYINIAIDYLEPQGMGRQIFDAISEHMPMCYTS